MGNDFKYTLQKHKGKLLVGGSLVTSVLIGASVWLIVSEDSPFVETEQPINYLASQVITSDEEGNVNLVGVDTSEILNTTMLPGAENYLYSPTPEREGVYAYDGKNLNLIRVVEGQLTTELVASGLPEINEPTKFAYAENQLAVYSVKESSVIVIDTLEKKVVNTLEEEEMVVDLTVGSPYVHFMTESEFVQVNQKDSKRIKLGETLHSLHTEDGKHVIQSGFGNSKGENVLFYINGDTMEIESLQKVGAPNSIMLSKDDGEAHYLAGHFVTSETPYYLMERYQVEAEGLTKDNLAIQVPLGGQEIAFNAENSVLDHDYIYTHQNDTLKVFDIKNQNFIHDIPVDVVFAMPVLTEEGRAHE